MVDFAIDLLFHTWNQMQHKTTELGNIARSIGLKIHPGKPTIIKVKTESTSHIKVDSRSLKEMDAFIYLGTGIDTKRISKQG